MDIYIVIFIATLFVFFFGKNNAIYWLFLLLLSFVYTFRSNEVGGDTLDYYYTFSRINDEGIDDHWHISPIEFSFYYWNKILYFLTDGSIRLFWFFSSLLMYFPIFYICRKYFRYAHRCVAFFVLQYDYFYSYCFLMQYISIVIVFVGLIKYSKSHKIYVYILSVLFATTFHSSAIVLLALIPLFKRHIPHVWWSFFIVLSYLVGRSGLLATVLNALNIGTLYDIYAVKEVVKFTLNGFILSTYIAFLIEIIDIDYIISVAVALGTIMMNLLAFNGDLARIHWYFSIFGIILFSHTKLKKKYMRMRSVIFIVSLMYGILVFWSFLLDNQSKIVPYTASFEL